MVHRLLGAFEEGGGGRNAPPSEQNPNKPKSPPPPLLPRGAFIPQGPVVKMGEKRTEMGKTAPGPSLIPPPQKKKK